MTVKSRNTTQDRAHSLRAMELLDRWFSAGLGSSSRQALRLGFLDRLGQSTGPCHLLRNVVQAEPLTPVGTGATYAFLHCQVGDQAQHGVYSGAFAAGRME